MEIENLKRWHWAIIGLLIGLVVGWIWSSLHDSGGLLNAVTLGSEQFERGLNAPSLEGHPKIKGITVHQSDGRYAVWMKVLEPDPNDPHPKNPRHYRYMSERLDPTTPFLPAYRESPSQTVMWRVNPSAVATPSAPSRHSTGPLPLLINGAAVPPAQIGGFSLDHWKIEEGKWSDPEAGAELALPLRPATYHMMIVLSLAQEKLLSGDDLTVTCNGNALAPLISGNKSSGAMLETTLPKEAFASGETQTLRFARKNEPVKIWEVRLIDPNYSIADFLNYAKQKHPELAFANAWWDAPRVRYTLCAVLGVLFFGGIWPTVVKLLTGAQAGRAQEPEYDLSRFKSEPEQKKPLATVPFDGDELSDLEEELRKGISSRTADSSQTKVQPPPAPVQLAAEQIAPIPNPDSDHPANYAGEYYPVARPTVDEEDESK